MFTNFESMPEDARIWLFLSTGKINSGLQNMILEKAELFLNQWTAHKKELRASLSIQFGHLLVFAVDEKVNEASGCSIDKLFHFVKEIDQLPGLDLLNRLRFAFLDEEQQWHVSSASEVKALLESRRLNADTAVLDLSLRSVSDLKQVIIPLKNSWLVQYLTHAE